MNLQFDELSRKAASNALSADERDLLDKFLREHPARQAQLDWDLALHAKLQAKVAAMPVLPGWERTVQALQAEHAAAARAASESTAAERAAAESTAAERSSAERSARQPKPVRAPGILDRLSDWLSSSLGFAFNAQAVAAALVVVQAGAIGWFAVQDTEPSPMPAGAPDASPRGPLLRVSFRQDLREAELRLALAGVGGEIVGGPGQIGVYLVRIKDGNLAAAAQRLRDGGSTELVEVVEAGR